MAFRMFHLQWIFVFLYFLIIFHKDVQSTGLSVPSINLRPIYSTNSIVLECDVKSQYVNDWNIYLLCPFIEGRLCYTNCKANCPPALDCLPIISSCSIKKINKDHIRLKWSIDVRFVNKSIEWQCTQRNNFSNSILLEKQSKFSSSVIANKRNTITKITRQPFVDVITLPRMTETHIFKTYEQDPHYSHFRFDMWNVLSQPNMVLILVCIFTTSLLLNIVFLIRCILFRYVIENYLQEKKPSHPCLFKCFCIPINRNLPTINMNIINQDKSPACFGYYRRDEIYDDMSSGSQTDRSLITNYPQCDRGKIWDQDRSYNIVNRPSQLCPSKSPGNYVLIKGPMYSNRNYLPLSPASEASIASNSQQTYITDIIGRSPSNEFERLDYERAIYSQPMKNRLRYFDPALRDGISNKYMNNFAPIYPPPLPPSRVSNNEICQFVTESTPLNTVDLIEHYTNSSTTTSNEKKSD